MGKRKLVLENGMEFSGDSLAYEEIIIGRTLFVRQMNAYLEVITDPGNLNLIAIFSNPLLGNYGVNTEDFESNDVTVKAAVCHSYSEFPANYRSQESLKDYFLEKNKGLLSGIETRKLAKILNEEGDMLCAIVPLEYTLKEVKALFDNYKEPKRVIKNKAVAYKTKNPKKQVLLLDFGLRKSVVDLLQSINCNITVVSPLIAKADLEKYFFDLIILSGSYKEINSDALKNLKEYINDYPVFAEGSGLIHLLKLHDYSVSLRKSKLLCDNHGVFCVNNKKIIFPSISASYLINCPDKEKVTHYDCLTNEILGVKLNNKQEGILFDLSDDDQSRSLLKAFFQEIKEVN